MDKEELEVLVKDYNSNKDSAKVLERWDVNKDGKLDIDELQVLHEDIESTQSAIRYTGYARTLPMLLRYTAYTSDVGESFRPIIYPKLVTLTYAISWAYVIGDVAYEGYKAHHHHHKDRNQVARIMTERGLFQSFASMIFPMFMIHSTVKFFQKRVFTHRYQRWGPTFAGLALIPALPFILDKPVEHIVHTALRWVWPSKDDHHHLGSHH